MLLLRIVISTLGGNGLRINIIDIYEAQLLLNLVVKFLPDGLLLKNF